MFEGKSPLKKWLHFDGLFRQGQNFPMNWLKIGHSSEAFTHLFGLSSDIWKLENHKLSGTQRESQQRYQGQQVTRLFRLLFYPTYPIFLSFSKIYKELLFAERRLMKIFLPNRYVNASYEWPIWKTFMLPECFFLPRQTIKVEAFFSIEICLAFKQHLIS
mgnify:CR=1 FL=1